MGEGVDPTKMCRRLVDRVGRWGQLFAVPTRSCWFCFEDWLDELEMEVVLLAKKRGNLNPSGLAHKSSGCLKGAQLPNLETETRKKIARGERLSWIVSMVAL